MVLVTTKIVLVQNGSTSSKTAVNFFVLVPL
jgi:hypothetical protein